MNASKKSLIFVIILFLCVAFGIIYIFSELYTESDIEEAMVTDAKTFKEEYESLNNKELEDGNKELSLEISETNPFIYKTPAELIKMIEDKEDFVVYFGFSSCSWCRNVLPALMASAEQKNIKEIVYVDIQDIRDTYELDENHKAVKTEEGTEDYYKLLELLDNVLDEYTPLEYKTKKGKTKKVKVNEKRIYAPSVIVVKGGKAISSEDGLQDDQTDPYVEQTEEQFNQSVYLFNCLFGLVSDEEDSSACICVDQKC